VRCSARFCFWQLLAATVQGDNIFKDVPPNTVCTLIDEGLVEDHTAKEACTALGLPGGYPAKEHSVPTMLLDQSQGHWQQHNAFFYFRMQLYVLAAG
jgi:hypothetical protein